MTRVAGLAMIAALVSSPLQAADSTIGAWHVHTEKDPFSPKAKTLALTGGADAALAIRCLGEDGLSVIVLVGGEKHFEPGTSVGFKYRADEGEIVEDKGTAFGEGTVEMPIARQVLADAEKAQTLYVRMETPTGSVRDLIFKTRGAAKALAKIKTDCPLEPAKPDEPAKPKT